MFRINWVSVRAKLRCGAEFAASALLAAELYGKVTAAALDCCNSVNAAVGMALLSEHSFVFALCG